jgi:hypothetical protein
LLVVSFRLLIGLLLAFLGFRLAVAGRGQGLKDLPPLIDWVPYRPWPTRPSVGEKVPRFFRLIRRVPQPSGTLVFNLDRPYVKHTNVFTSFHPRLWRTELAVHTRVQKPPKTAENWRKLKKLPPNSVIWGLGYSSSCC